MTGADFQALLPLLVLAVGALVLMLQIAFWRNINVSAWLTALSFVLALPACLAAAEAGPIQVTTLLLADPMALLFCALFAFAGLVTTLLSVEHISRRGDQPEEYFLLLLLSTLGACVLAYSVHLISLFLGMELLSVALYVLIAYPDKSMLPLEAATKYLVLSAAASATMLFGFALLYAATGSLGFVELGQGLVNLAPDSGLVLAASLMILVGLGFKLSLVPFHFWAPDVYQGAPAPVSGFLASVSKAAIFLVLLRFYLQSGLFGYPLLIDCIALIAIASMLVGNLLALQQHNIKRLLAYSSIAHMGYLLVILVVAAASDSRLLATEAALYYLIAYTATTLAAFGLLSLLCARQTNREKVNIADLRGLFWSHPLLALMMLVALLSLAGIPLTAGFIAKFYIFNAAASGGHWTLLACLVIGSGIGIYYYLRVIYSMTLNETRPRVPADGMSIRTLCCVLIASILLLGILPAPLMEYIRGIL